LNSLNTNNNSFSKALLYEDRDESMLDDRKLPEIPQNINAKTPKN